MKRIGIAILILLVAGHGFAGEETVEYRLDNGMKLIVKPDRRAPIVVSQVWYKVGASYEPDGVTGVSHVLEHMMFKGTASHGPNEFSRIISENGGEENAFTGNDYTAYFQTLASDRLEVALELEADRMRNLTLAAEEFAKEVEVVKEERRLRTEDKPTALTYEQFQAVAYRSLPYGRPVIGWMNDLENMTVEDLERWYRLWYAPNNATLVVAGDVEPAAVLTMVKRHFGGLKPESIPILKPLREPSHHGTARLVVRAPAKQPYLLMGYRTPVIATAAEPWEPYALEMLAAVLDGGDSARFSRNLIRGSEVAASAGADYGAFSRLPGLFELDGIPAAGRTVDELEQALLAEVETLKETLVDEAELERIRAQVVAERVFEQDSLFYQAMQIGALETQGYDWRLLDEYVDNMRGVTAEQIRQVARKYLVEDQLTVARLDPRPMASVEGSGAGGERNDG